MSASQDKNARELRRSESADRKRSAADEETRKAQAFRRNTIIAIVCIVLIVVAAAVINSNLFYHSSNAVTIGNTGYSAAEVDVFYRNTYNSIYSGFGDYASYFIDTSTPLTEQNYYGSEDQTWADYIYAQTLDNMKEITALYDEAMRNGYTLSEEDVASLDSQVSSAELYASMSGFSSADQYLTAYYGKGVNTKIFRSVLEKMLIAQNWSEQIREGYSYTAEQLDAYYDEHADELDVISYYNYTVSASDAAFEELADADARLAAAKETAEGFAAAGSAEDFAAAVEAFSGVAPTENHNTGSTVSSYSAEAAEWLLDSARRSGDTTVIESDTGAAVYWFTSRDNNDYRLANMRHILINVEADENGEYTDEAREAAKAEIERIAGEWQADPTEDHFAELANANSDDTGSNTNGGLYENIYRHQMVPGIDSFLFDEGANAGDTAQVYNEGSYTGWHLVYYVGENEDSYRHEQADSALRSDAYNEYLESLKAGYEVSEGSGARYIKKS